MVTKAMLLSATKWWIREPLEPNTATGSCREIRAAEVTTWTLPKTTRRTSEQQTMVGL
jgi:hypothetical protein